MSALQERAIQMIGRLSDQNIRYVIEYIRRLPEPDEPQETNSMKAFKELEAIIGGFPDDFSYEKELGEALKEKYGSID